MKDFKLLEDLYPTLEPTSQSLNICLVTPELVEFYQNGGIGTATSGLMQALHSQGHKITVFYTGDAPSEDDIRNDPRWDTAVKSLRSKGINLIFLVHTYGNDYKWPPRKASFACYDFLKTQDFDVIHFNDYGGNGFYSTTARKAGLAFTNSKIVTTIHGPTLWAMEADMVTISDLSQYERSWMELRAIENSDFVIGVSAHLLKWLTEKNVKLPPHSYVHKNCHPPVATLEGYDIEPKQLKRVVFFGRLDLRKGVDVFVAAMKKFGPAHPGVEIAFFGKFNTVAGEHSAAYVLHRLHDLPNTITFNNKLDRDSALRELSKPGTLAVMPSHDENSPCVIVECETTGIPFLAADVGGSAELVAPEDRATVMFEPTPKALEAKLAYIWENGHPVVRPNRTAQQVADVWSAFHLTISADEEPQPPAFTAENAPLVSVCITHFRRPWMLPQLIKVIEEQDYPNVEIIIADDFSNDAVSNAMLDSLENRTGGRYPLTIVRRQVNGYLGAARNSAVAASKGVYLKFQDDDNLPGLNEISSMVRAAQRLRAGAVTSLAYQFSDEIPEDPSYKDVTYFPIGGCAPLAYVRNEFGDANALVSRKAFNKVKGFTEDYGIGAEDYELFAKILSSGEEVIALPEPLFYYRVSGDSMLQTGSIYKNAMRAKRGFEKMPRARLEVLAEMQFGKHLQEEANGVAWYRIGKYRHGWLHQQMLGGDPNSPEAMSRVEEMLRLYGRVNDAFNMALQRRTVTDAVAWLQMAMHRYERGESDMPIMVDLSKTHDIHLMRPLPSELPDEWVNWSVINVQFNGVLVHPVRKMVTEALLPGAIAAQARSISVKWIHGSADGEPVEVSIGVGTGGASDWVRLDTEGEVVLDLDVPLSERRNDLILRSRAVDSDRAAHAIAASMHVSFK